ncbi:MAG: P1 family peptidase [Coriobacteriia bacterium]|nr:P1 family peptidase [Coriobacteriia bacterium]
MKEIAITDIAGVRFGHATDEIGGTGCTVVLTEQGAPTGADIRGGGPASRETELLSPVSSAEGIHALLLSGGSAFGLDAAGGVMRFLEDKGIGVDVGIAHVPLVVASDIFDLDYRSADARPDVDMAQSACLDAAARGAEGAELPQGSVGVGTGATVGKAQGPAHAMKSGFGHFAVQIGPVQMGALVVCNAIGDVFDIETGEQLAGMRDDSGAFVSSEHYLYDMIAGKVAAPSAHTNTTLCVVVTNVAFDKTKMTKIASMAQNGLARTIRPVHTSFDGDAVFAMSVGQIQLPALAIDALGTLAAYVVGKAINNAVRLA